MNNPCEVIRKISDGFSEIEVFPEFADSLEGSQWCTACIVGGMDGAHPTHTCEEYEDVIEAIRDTQASMVVVVENRLLQDKPVEFAKWSEAITQIKSIKSEIDDEQKHRLKLKWRNKDLLNKSLIAEKNVDLKREKIDLLNENINEIEIELSGLKSSLGTAKGLVSVGSVTLSMSIHELKELISNSLTLEKLNAGKVHNWAWYDESLNGFDSDAETDDFISNLKIETID